MLFICPTPIGNLGDVTYRVIETLKNADLIACEDTRTTIKLLNHYEIKKPLISYHEHNEQYGTQQILEHLRGGKQVALVSDAGMPGISDPGEVLIKACILEGIEYTVLPGASAMVTAVVASQLATQPFHYEGFLDRNKRKQRLEKLKELASTLIFYESPHRVQKTLADLLLVFGDRQITLARELTKRYETYLHTTLSEAVTYYETNEPRGEYVIVVGGHVPVVEAIGEDVVLEMVRARVLAGERIKDVVKELAKLHNVDRQALYKLASEK